MEHGASCLGKKNKEEKVIQTTRGSRAQAKG